MLTKAQLRLHDRAPDRKPDRCTDYSNRRPDTCANPATNWIPNSFPDRPHRGADWIAHM